jgi:hypothetical protein
MNDPLINPAAHVQESKQFNLGDTTRRLKKLLLTKIRNDMEIGMELAKIFARFSGTPRKDYIAKHFRIQIRQAQRYVKLWNERTDEIEKIPCVMDDADAEAQERFQAALDRNMQILMDEHDVSSGSVPYASNGTPVKQQETGSERESGDMTPAEIEQDKIVDGTNAKIAAMLCPRCKRVGDGTKPCCDPCRAKAFKIQSGIPLRNPDGSKPAQQPKNHPLNGTVAVDWSKYRKLVTEQTKFIQDAFKFVDAEVSPVAEKYRAKFEGLLLEFRAEWEKLSKQKVPNYT